MAIKNWFKKKNDTVLDLSNLQKRGIIKTKTEDSVVDLSTSTTTSTTDGSSALGFLGTLAGNTESDTEIPTSTLMSSGGKQKLKGVLRDLRLDAKNTENLIMVSSKMVIKELDKKILAYALKNAIEHNGKSNSQFVLRSLFHEGLKKDAIKTTLSKIQKTVNKINSLSLEKQKKQYSELSKQTSERKIREGLPPLPNAKKGKVVMRFAPYPSGPLHIGNARTLILNDEYAKMYKGKLLFVIDDTIGSQEKQIIKEAYDLIPEAADLLGVKYRKPIIKKSSRLNIYYKYAEQLIKKDKAYVCDCPVEELRENREKGVECSCRQYPKEMQMKRWKKMFKGRQGQYTLRIKTNMQHKNPAFRDRVIFRISERSHPLIKRKHKVWPLLDFSWAIDDHLLKMTHVLRGKELMIETEMQKHIFKIFSWKCPEFIHLGHFGFQNLKLSKSKGQKEVREGRYTGWDDPRTWSIQSLMKRGIQPEIIRNFIISLGRRQTEITVPLDVLYTENRKILKTKAKVARFKQTQDQSGNLQITMPDGMVITGNTIAEPKKGDIIYFKDLGYTRFDRKSKDKLIFYFSHK